MHVKIDSEHLPKLQYALRGLVLKDGSKVLKVSKAAEGVSGLKVLKALWPRSGQPLKSRAQLLWPGGSLKVLKFEDASEP